MTTKQATGRPPLNLDLTKKLLKNLYNLDQLLIIKELNGYDDRNFYIKTNDSKEFILKITNSDESEVTGLLESFNSFILHLHNNGIKVTVPQINTQGTYLSFQRITPPDEQLDQISSDKVYGFRLLEYIPGKLLLNVPFTPSILRECGQFLAKMTIALKNFKNSVLSVRKSFWSLLSVLHIRQYLDAVEDPLRRSMVSDTLEQFESQVLNHLDEFEHSLIHADFNEQNIIVDTTPTDQTSHQNEYHVKGVIDFGDVHYAPKVFDLAIYLAYSMFEFKAGPQILAPGFGLSGYMSCITLSESELNVLYVCIKARLCQSLVMGAHSYRMDPTNIYVLSSAKNGWPALRGLHECNPNDILYKWLNINKLFPN